MIFFTWNSSRLLWRCSFCFIFCHNTVAMVEGAHDCDKLMTTQLCCNFFQLQKQHVLCIDLNLQVSIFFVTSVGFFFLTSISRFLFYDLYVLIAIGFHFYDLYVLSHCHRVPFFWPLCSHCHRVPFTGHDFFKLKTDATKTMTNLWSLLHDFSMTNLWSLIYDFFMTNLWSLIMWLAQLDNQRLVKWLTSISHWCSWSIFSFSVAKATLNNNLWHIYFSDAIICVQ